MKALLAALSFVVCANVFAQAAPFWLWKSRLDGRLFCAQVVRGGGWDKIDGPFRDARCSQRTAPDSIEDAVASSGTENKTTIDESSVEVGYGFALQGVEPASVGADALINTTPHSGVRLTYKGGGSVQIRAFNELGLWRSCTAQLAYKTGNHATGWLNCSGSIPPNARDVLLCERKQESEMPYTVFPGSFSCF
jgi:hypothetical protein